MNYHVTCVEAGGPERYLSLSHPFLELPLLVILDWLLLSLSLFLISPFPSPIILSMNYDKATLVENFGCFLQ